MRPSYPALFAATLLLAIPTGALAQTRAPSAEERSLAREKAEEGLKLFGADRFVEAFERFKQAQSLNPAPTLLLYMARCQRKLGKLVESRDLYEQILVEPVPKDAPDPFLEAQSDARRELAALRLRIPTVQILASGVPKDTMRATVNGVSVPIEDERIELNPGEHTVEVFSPRAKRPEQREIKLTEGTAMRLEITLTPLGALSSADETKPDAPKASTAAPTRSSFVPSIVVLGIGALGLGVGAATGLVSLAKVDEIKARCVNGLCPPADEAEAETARTLGTASTISLVVGGVGVMAGMTMLIVNHRQAISARHVQLGIGPTSLQLQGTF